MSKLEDNILASGMYNSDLEIKRIEYDPNGKPNSQKAIPTIPLIIKYEKDYYVKTSNNPLEYSSATFGKATKA